MLALILGIAATAGWIAFDVAISIVTYPLMPTYEWRIFVASGVLLIILTIVSEVMSYTAHERDEQRHTAEHDILASGSLKILGQLQNVTNTSGEPVVKTIEMATSKIEAMQQELKMLNERSARRISADQRRKFREALNGKVPWIREMYCISLDSEADAYAKQLTRMFREAGMNAGYSFLVDNYDSPTLDQFGLTIHHKNGEFPDDARDLAWALDQAGIKYGLTTERVVAHADPHYVGVRVGRKPE